jgi:hypothetical protein
LTPPPPNTNVKIMNRTKQIGVALPPNEREFVAEEARRLGITLSEFVRRTLQAYGAEGRDALRLPAQNILTQGQHKPRGHQEGRAA